MFPSFSTSCCNEGIHGCVLLLMYLIPQALVKREGVTGEGSPLSPHERALFSNLEEKRKKKEGKTSKRRSKKGEMVNNAELCIY